MKILVFSENFEITSQLCAYSSKFGEIVAASGARDEVHISARKYYGFQGDMQYDNCSAELSRIMKQESCDFVIIGSTVLGRDVASHLDASLNVGVAPELVEFSFEGTDLHTKRWGLGGKTILEEKWHSRILTVVPGICDADSSSSPESVEEVKLGQSKVTVVSREGKTTSGSGLENAKIIVSVGRGIGKKEGISVAEDLAKAVNGEIAGSRPICLDYQWLKEDRQVGLSGKKVKPNIYIALGISGQIQHIAGMRGSRTVIAVNKDKSAPIFEESDYGIVGDLYQIVPEITKRLKQ
ncbi:MAG: electron transfer flavoprotein subunit alpha/FixB family protein [Candidatus Thermoplasmatota archaeon]|nr:electron transfer flavoprotein subunit alpha/FixB family protein [Candidatus Thermoplasmatota archaeon]